MARNLQLTWQASRNCWRKVRGTKAYYLGKGKCQGKTDMEGYRQALAEWHQIQADLDRQENPALSIANTPGPVNSLTADPDPQVLQFLKTFMAMRAENPSLPELPPAFMMASNYSGLLDSLPSLASGSATAIADRSISGLISEFLKERRNEAESQQRSLVSYRELCDKLNDFGAFAKAHGKTEIDEIDATVLSAYRQSQLSLMARDDSNSIAAATAKKRLSFVARFMRWAHDLHAIDQLPRVLNSKFTAIELPKPKPLFYSVDEIKLLFSVASSRTKLLIALALNAAYTQQDIASLTHSMIDWKNGLICRERSKTGTPQRAKLWPITLSLLKTHATKPDPSKPGNGLVLVGEGGLPLLHAKIRDDGKLTNTDAVYLAFCRLKKTKKVDMAKDPRGFKHLRKTSADLIAGKFAPHIRDLHLAHTDKNPVAAHYSASNVWDELFAAQTWLGGQLDLKV